MRSTIRSHPIISGSYSNSIEECAHDLNTIIRGWTNNYGRFGKSSLKALYRYIIDKLARWIMREFKSLQRGITRAGKWFKNLYLRNLTYLHTVEIPEYLLVRNIHTLETFQVGD